MTLTWRRHRPGVLVKAQIEASSDLSQWQPLVDSVTLADIRHGDFRLENRAILLPTRRTDMDYLRLSWLIGSWILTAAKADWEAVSPG